MTSGLFGELRRADRAVPDERRDIVQRAGDRREALQRRAEAALPVDSALASGVDYSPALFVNGERYTGELDPGAVTAALEDPGPAAAIC